MTTAGSHLQATHHIFLQFLGWSDQILVASCGQKPWRKPTPKPQTKANSWQVWRKPNVSHHWKWGDQWPVTIHDGMILPESNQELGNGTGNLQNYQSQTFMYFYMIKWIQMKVGWPLYSRNCNIVSSLARDFNNITPPGFFIPPYTTINCLTSHHPTSPATFITFCHCCATLPSQGFKAKSAVRDVRHSPAPVGKPAIGISLKS